VSKEPTEAIERAEELIVSQARLSFDERRVAIRRDDLREILRFVRAMVTASPPVDHGRVAELEAERDKWKQRAWELECKDGDLKGVFVETTALTNKDTAGQ
jgi:hypothetical protein